MRFTSRKNLPRGRCGNHDADCDQMHRQVHERHVKGMEELQQECGERRNAQSADTATRAGANGRERRRSTKRLMPSGTPAARMKRKQSALSPIAHPSGPKLTQCR